MTARSRSWPAKLWAAGFTHLLVRDTWERQWLRDHGDAEGLRLAGAFCRRRHLFDDAAWARLHAGRSPVSGRASTATATAGAGWAPTRRGPSSRRRRETGVTLEVEHARVPRQPSARRPSRRRRRTDTRRRRGSAHLSDRAACADGGIAPPHVSLGRTGDARRTR